LYSAEGVSSWGISSERLVVDAGLGSVGIAKRESIGSVLGVETEDGFSQKESTGLKFFAKSDSRYIVAVPFRNVVPLGVVLNWLVVNEEAVILS